MAGIDDGEEQYRRESVAAFAHEIRTPLTAIRMVLELAEREGNSDSEQLVLDAELARMLSTSVDDLQQLVDDLQEASRLERGKLQFGAGPCELGPVVAAARELAGPRVTLAANVPADLAGPWDARRLARAMADFATTANRLGDGSGTVAVRYEPGGPGVATVRIASGSPGGAGRGIGADAGFGFFHARLVVMAMGGAVEWQRQDRWFEVTLRLPA